MKIREKNLNINKSRVVLIITEILLLPILLYLATLPDRTILYMDSSLSVIAIIMLSGILINFVTSYIETKEIREITAKGLRNLVVKFICKQLSIVVLVNLSIYLCDNLVVK